MVTCLPVAKFVNITSQEGGLIVSAGLEPVVVVHVDTNQWGNVVPGP